MPFPHSILTKTLLPSNVYTGQELNLPDNYHLVTREDEQKLLETDSDSTHLHKVTCLESKAAAILASKKHDALQMQCLIAQKKLAVHKMSPNARKHLKKKSLP